MIYVFIKDKDELIGQTSIQVFKNGIEANQMLTGIKTQYRRQGLSFFIKTKLYQELKSNYPKVKFVYTDCFAKNLPMIKANEKFGFKEDYEVSELFFIQK